MLRSLARTLVATALLFTLTGAASAHAQDPIRLASTAAAGGNVRHIDVSDWLNAQTVDLVGMQARTGPQVDPPALGNIAFLDYAGRRALVLGLSFGFSASGSVRVRELPDGTGDVLVNLSFTNAITWAFNVGGVPIFGYSPGTLAGNPSLTPGLSSGSIQAKYIVPDPANPELNLFQVAFFGGGTLTQLKFHSDGEGPLRSGFGVPEGTPGECVLANTGIFDTRGGGATADGWPVERVDVRTLGGDEAVSASPTASGASSRRRAGAVHAQTSGGTAGPTVSGSWGQIKALYRNPKIGQ